jgi:hypothetical protein
MWVYAQERARSCRVTTHRCASPSAMARNLARNMARKYGRELHLPPDEMPETAVAPEPPPDPLLRRAIRECFEKLARQPLLALRARLVDGHHQGRRRLARGNWHDGEHVPAEHRPRPAATREVSERTGCRCSGDGTMSRRDDQEAAQLEGYARRTSQRDAEDCRSPRRNGWDLSAGVRAERASARRKLRAVERAG